MGSEQNESASLTQSTEPKLCANGCGFFGSPSNMDLCSKCYRSICADQTRGAVEIAAVEKSRKPSPPVEKSRKPSPPCPPRPPRALFIAEPAVKSQQEESSSPLSSVGEEKEVEVGEDKEISSRPKRCLCCNKKVGILGFKCKCGRTYCGEHRYPERHECSFDYKGIGRGEIAKANPVVKADKVQRF